MGAGDEVSILIADPPRIQQMGRKQQQKGCDRWSYFAWGVLAFLITFHIVNNYIVLKLDTIYFVEDPAELYHGTVVFLEGLSKENVLEKISSFYTDFHFGYPPFFQSVSALSLAICGYSHDTAVMANAPFLAVLLISTYLLGKELFDRETGLLAAILLSFFPIVFSMSRLYRVDFALTAMVALTMLFVVRSRHMTLRKESLLAGLLLGLTALTNPSFVLFLIGPVIILIAVPVFKHIRAAERGATTPILLNIVLAVLIAALIACPWYASHAKTYLDVQREILPVSPFGPTPKQTGQIMSDIKLHSPAWLLGTLILKPAAWLFGIGLLYLLFKYRRQRAPLLSWILVPYPFFMAVDFAHSIWLARHFVPVLPAVALVIALLIRQSVLWLSKRFLQIPKRSILAIIFLILVIEIPLFLAITYVGSGTLEEPFGKEKVGKERIFRTYNLGRTSPYRGTFELEEVTTRLGHEWASHNEAPDVFFLNPEGIISKALLSEMRVRQIRGEFNFREQNCYSAWYPEDGEESDTSCEDIFDTSDYAIIEANRYDELAFENEEKTYSQKIAPLSEHMKRSLANRAVLLTLAPHLDYTDPHDVHHPCFDWLNESLWILRKNE